MKILHILPDLSTGGAQKFCIDLCNELAKDSTLDVTICSIDKIGEHNMIMYNSISSNVKFISLNKDSKNPFIIFKVAKMILKERPDIVHTHLKALLLSSFGLLISRVPDVHTIHTVAHKETTKGRLKYYKILYDYFNFIPISINKEVLKSTTDLYGSRHNKVIDNGVAKVKKSPEYTKTEEFINSLKSTKESKIFVSVGRFYNVKNQELLIEAFEELLSEGFDAHLLILGSLDVIPEYAKLCQSKIKSRDNIHLLGEVSNVSDYLLCSDALCFSSIYEGFPMAIIEAMSVGVPTISTPVGGIPYVVKDFKSGYLSKDMSVESYKEALKMIFTQKEIDKEELIREYESRYSIEMCAKNYLELYRDRVDG